MSQLTRDAFAEFERALEEPLNLVRSHKSMRPGPGRRWKETSINRANVVLLVATWQSFVEDLMDAILRTIEPARGSPHHGHFVLVNASSRSALGRFNTPNAYNTRDLFLNVGFDPRPDWTWRPRRGAGAVLTVGDVEARLNHWLSVRHAVAHGADLPNVPVVTGSTNNVPTLRLTNVEAGIAFFKRLAEVTSGAADKKFP